MYNECRHIMPSGKKCHSPALREKPYCYYHINLHRPGHRSKPAAKKLLLPGTEDANGIQVALTQVLDALNSPRMDPRRASMLLYGLQIATQLTNRVSALELSESVGSHSESNDDVLAPEITVCEPEEDCIRCCDYATCEKEERIDGYKFSDDQ